MGSCAFHGCLGSKVLVYPYMRFLNRLSIENVLSSTIRRWQFPALYEQLSGILGLLSVTTHDKTYCFVPLTLQYQD